MRLRVLDVSSDTSALLLEALGTLGSTGMQKFGELRGNTDHEKLLIDCCRLQPSIDHVGDFFSFARVNLVGQTP